MYFRYLFLNVIIYVSLINNDNICRKYENEKYLEFNFKTFKNAFNNDFSKNEGVYNEEKGFSKLVDNRFKKFKMNEKAREPIIYYCKELIEKRKEKILKNNKFLKSKIDKFNILIEKTIEYLKNFLLVYTEPIKNYEFQINHSNLLFKPLEDIFDQNHSIHLKKFDFYLFIDFENNENVSYNAYNISNFSKLKYNSRPILGYLKINLYQLNDDEVKYEEIMTLIHEIMHYFGLVEKDQIIKTLNKFELINKNNQIRKYIEKYNDFYKLYIFLKNKNLLHKLFKDDHFNPNYLYNDIMQPNKAYIKHFTYISSGLFEILTNYEIRINKKILRRNYNSCLPLLKELFQNNCENSKGNFIKSMNLNEKIKLNNKCSKNESVDNFCDPSYQYKRYCNYKLNNNQNPFCYKSISDENSNCFDDSNNNNGFSTFDEENIKQYYGKKSNCFEIKKLYSNINPICFKNNIDLKNYKIEIIINKKYGYDLKLYCKYKKRYDSNLNKYIFEKINETVSFINNYYDQYKIFCPNLNEFYYNNISNLCENDCNLNGRCIGLNKCACFNGYDPKNNCKTLIEGYNKNNNYSDYIFKTNKTIKLNKIEEEGEEEEDSIFWSFVWNIFFEKKKNYDKVDEKKAISSIKKNKNTYLYWKLIKRLKRKFLIINKIKNKTQNQMNYLRSIKYFIKKIKSRLQNN